MYESKDPDRRALLATAATQRKNAIESIMLIGDTGAVDTTLLNQRTGLKIQTEKPENRFSELIS